jgi:hypothetical protein
VVTGVVEEKILTADLHQSRYLIRNVAKPWLLAVNFSLFSLSLKETRDITMLGLFLSSYNPSLELLENRPISHYKKSFTVPSVNIGPQ